MNNIIQTFFINAASVNNAEFVALTSVDLFFEAKPNNRGNASGILNPSVKVAICDVVNEQPRPDRTYRFKARQTYEGIAPSSDAKTPTTFAFENPVVVESGRHYGIIVSFDDPGYSVWRHVSGERTVGTNVASPNVTDNRNGKFYQYTSSSPTPVVDTALKFSVNVARFDSSPQTLMIRNHGYEFIAFNNNVDALQPGEIVYANTANSTGTVNIQTGSKTVSGSGTAFTSLTEEQHIVFKSGSNVFVGQVEYINDDASLTLFEPVPISNSAASFAVGTIGTIQRVDYQKNKLVLSGSNATASNKFAVGQQVTGVNSKATARIASLDHFEIDRIVSNLDITIAGDSTYSPRYKTVKFDGTYTDDDVESPLPNKTEVLTDEKSILASRSLEVTDANIFDEGSVAVVVDVATTNPFAAPIIDLNSSTLVLTSEVIDNTYLSTDANGNTIDSEVFNGGVAINKHYTKKLTLSEGRVAEDLKVFLTGYRPRSTDIRVYAKFRASGDQEPFDDKLWTPLEETGENQGTFSSSVDRNDLIELQYSVPSTPVFDAALAGSFTTANGSNLISSSAGYNPTVDLQPGDFIKIYNELFPTNYMVTTVSSVNSTTITVADKVTLNGILGTGQKIAKLKYGRTAYTYEGNDNVLQYLDETGGVHNGFVEAQLKVVFLGDPAVRISPRVDQLEMIGVSS